MEPTIYLKELLYIHDCVVVPGLGGFVCTLHKFEFNPQEGFILPARRTVVFNQNLTINDGLLANHLAQKNHTDYTEALENINAWVGRLHQSLQAGQTIVLDGIGTLQLGADKQWVYIPAADANFLADAYGLGQVTLGGTVQKITSPQPVIIPNSKQQNEDKPAEKQIPVAKPQKQKPGKLAKTAAKKETKPIPPPRPQKINKNKPAVWRRFGVGILFILLLAALFVLQDFMYHVRLNKHIFHHRQVPEQQTNPSSQIEDTDAEKGSIASVVPASSTESSQKATDAQPAVDTNPSVTAQTDSVFYIIAGAFKSAENAQHLKTELGHKGFEPHIIKTPGASLIRVGYRQYATRAEAQNSLHAVRKEANNPAAWVMALKK